MVTFLAPPSKHIRQPGAAAYNVFSMSYSSGFLAMQCGCNSAYGCCLLGCILSLSYTTSKSLLLRMSSVKVICAKLKIVLTMY